MPQTCAVDRLDDLAVRVDALHGVADGYGQQTADFVFGQRDYHPVDIGASDTGPSRIVDQYPVVRACDRSEMLQTIEYGEMALCAAFNGHHGWRGRHALRRPMRIARCDNDYDAGEPFDP